MPGIGVARVFDWGWGRAKPQTTCNDVIRHFRKRNFLWEKDIVDCIIRSRGLCLAHKQDFGIGRGLKPKAIRVNWETIREDLFIFGNL